MTLSLLNLIPPVVVAQQVMQGQKKVSCYISISCFLECHGIETNPCYLLWSYTFIIWQGQCSVPLACVVKIPFWPHTFWLVHTLVLATIPGHWEHEQGYSCLSYYHHIIFGLKKVHCLVCTITNGLVTCGPNASFLLCSSYFCINLSYICHLIFASAYCILYWMQNIYCMKRPILLCPLTL